MASHNPKTAFRSDIDVFDTKIDMFVTELGFDSVSANSMDAVGDRDYIIEFLFWGTMVATHLRFEFFINLFY